MNINERFYNLDRAIVENRLIRNAWTEGRDRVCLLAAISPEVAENKEASTCPSDLIPPWLAKLTPYMNGSGTPEKWPEFVRRYAAIVRKAATTLDSASWHKAEFRARLAIIREAMAHTDNKEMGSICPAVISLCERVVRGDEPDESEWAAVKAAAWDRMNTVILDAIEAEIERVER